MRRVRTRAASISHGRVTSSVEKSGVQGTELMYAIVADGHEVAVFGTSLVLSRAFRCERIDTARSSDDLLGKMDHRRPDLLIFDMHIPGAARHADLIRLARRKAPHSRIIVQSSCSAPLGVEAALQAGADGYVRKDRGVRELVKALRHTQQGKLYVPAGMLEEALLHPWKQLSTSERQVLVALANGTSLSSLAQATGRAYKTVTNQKYAALEKLGQGGSVDVRAYLLAAGLSHLLSD